MQEELNAIITEVREKTPTIKTRVEFEEYKATISGPGGALTRLMKGMGALPKEEKPAMGKLVNQAKDTVQATFTEAIRRIEAAELTAKLSPPIDPTLPSPDRPRGSIHPIAQIREEVVDRFRRIGFCVAEATEVETEYYCFDALNIPNDHPARDMQDSYYLPRELHVDNVRKKGEERYLLRTHTSTVQIRTMLKKKPPIRIVAPGRCFRRDTADATHSANFHQLEGLYVDKQVTLSDLKSTLDYFVKTMFGPKSRTRLRPSFFPFTEPSFEMDFHLPGSDKQWLEIMGCGMVDPEVFQAVGLDTNVYSGYAFGMGLERIAMILQKVDDIRDYYQNDLRFLKQFA